MSLRDPPLELSLSSHGLEGREEEIFPTEGVLFGFSWTEATLSEIVELLEQTYCGTMALEASHLSVSVCIMRDYIETLRMGLSL